MQGMSSIPTSGRFRMVWGSWATKHVLCNEKPPQWEAQALQLESGSCLPQLEKAHAQQQILNAAKKLKKKKFFFSFLIKQKTPCTFLGERWA